MINCHECQCFLSPPCNACLDCSHVDLDDATRTECDYTCATCPYPPDSHPETVLAGMTPETHPEGDATPMVECPECHGDTGPSMMTRTSGYIYNECGTCGGVGKVRDFGTSRNPESILEEMSVIIGDNAMISRFVARQIAMKLMHLIDTPEPKPEPKPRPNINGATPHFYIHTGGQVEQMAPIDSRGLDDYFAYPRTVRGGLRYPSPPGVGQPSIRNNIIY